MKKRAPIRAILSVRTAFLVFSLLLLSSVAGALTTHPTPAAAQEEKTLVYVTPSLALTMDPCFLPGQQTAEIIQNLYRPWTNYAQIDGPDGMKVDDTASAEANMQPGILERWENSEDGKVWTLHIRPGVKDNFGNELKAEDMVWILKRLREAGGCTFIIDAMNIQDVDKQVKILDDYTVEVTLPAPNPIFLRALNVNNASPFGPEARKHATADDPWALEWMKRNAPSIGPYMLESWEPGVQQVLVRNPNYYGPAPEIGRIIYRQVPESANRVALLISGDAQIARDLTQDELDTVDAADGVHAQCIAANQFVYVVLNFAEGKPTADPKVRQALAYAVPYQDIIDSVYRGRAKPLYGFATDTYAHFIGADAFPYVTDVDKAKALLAESAYPNGFDATILVDAGVPEHERIAVLLKDAFAKIGVNLTIDKKPTAAHRELAFGRQFGDMVLDQNYAFIVDPNYHTLVWLINAPPPNFNYGNFVDEEFNQIQADGVAMAEGDERDVKMKRLQEIAIEQLPWLSMANAPTCFGMSDRVSGFVWHTHNQIMFDELTLAD
ncbi:MAG: ABC transporter substrate-binding protein [Thermomicrobiales bacterium]